MSFPTHFSCVAMGPMVASPSTPVAARLAMWLFPGDSLTSAELYAITSSENGGTSYFDQTVNFTQSGCVGNEYGYNVCNESTSFSGPTLNAGTYWVNLQNASVPSGNPIYWDEKTVGPSLASESSVGTIPSESFPRCWAAAVPAAVPAWPGGRDRRPTLAGRRRPHARAARPARKRPCWAHPRRRCSRGEGAASAEHQRDRLRRRGSRGGRDDAGARRRRGFDRRRLLGRIACALACAQGHERADRDGTGRGPLLAFARNRRRRHRPRLDRDRRDRRTVAGRRPAASRPNAAQRGEAVYA